MDNYALGDTKHHLLVVEDDTELASLVQEYLNKSGFEVSVVANGLDAVKYITEKSPDLVILDIMLPGLSGMDVCRQVRPNYLGPILMLTALDEDMDQMLGLELGADDYVIKPIKPRLLLSRIKALLRRVDNKPQVNSALRASQEEAIPETIPRTLEINPTTRHISIEGKSITLTTAEYDLLKMLIDAAGDIVSRESIIQNLRGFDYDGLDRSIDRRISRLRKKLLDDPLNPQIIKTVRGKGYLLCSPVKETPSNWSASNS